VVVTTGLYGGAFDPPHLGHVGLARVAKLTLDIEALLVLVSEAPGHKDVHASADDRLALARAAFPGDEVRLDPYPRTVDFLRAEEFDEPLFVIGADEFQDFLTWKEPDEVVARARLAVATRPGYPRAGLDAVLAGSPSRSGSASSTSSRTGPPPATSAPSRPPASRSTGSSRRPSPS
jgi:cytidyltransferase-related domain